MRLVNFDTSLSLHMPGIHCIQVVDHIKNGSQSNENVEQCCLDLITNMNLL